MAPGNSPDRPPAHSGRFTFVEWDKDQPTNRSLSTQHVTREIRRQKRLQQEALARKSQGQSPSQASSSSASTSSPEQSSKPSPPSTPPTEQPSTTAPTTTSTRVSSTIASGRVGKTSKPRKKAGSSKPVLTPKSTNERTSQPPRKAYGISIWELLSEGDIDPRPVSPPRRTESQDSASPRRDSFTTSHRYLPSPLDPLTSYRRNALMGIALSSPADYNLLDYWLATAPRMLHLDILPPSQQNRKPTFELFFPLASKAMEAVEHIIMLPAVLAWATAAPPNPFVAQMLSVHRAKSVQYLNNAIGKLVDQKIVDEYTHVGLMSLIWAENSYGDAKQAEAYSLVFREMAQLRRKQNLPPPARAGTVMAHWYNAMTTTNFWPKGNLKQKEMVDAESLLHPMFPFLESVRDLAYNRKFIAASAADRQRYLSPTSPLTIILLSADPFNATSSRSLEQRGERYIRFRSLLLFRVLLFLHSGLLSTATYAGPAMLSTYFDSIEYAIKDWDILASPSPLALLLWAVLNDSHLSSVEAQRSVAMWIYPVRRLRLGWLSRLNNLLLAWLGLPIGGAREARTHHRTSETTVHDIELDRLPDTLMSLVITSDPHEHDSASDNGNGRSHGRPQDPVKRESFPQAVK